jgi:pimeloyl-ACP methyl ester carboxylesterase
MSEVENGSVGEGADTVGMLSSDLPAYKKRESLVINCPVIGNVDVTVQGNRSAHEVVILTVHDLGCDHTMYQDFIEHPNMSRIRERTVWVNVDIPGQSQDAADLPEGYEFPTMQKIAEDLIHILEYLKIRDVVCFGEGAGANILARFAMANQDRVLGVVLIHCTGTTAGFMESLKDKVINWKLDHVGMNPSAEAYLVLHRFGSVIDARRSSRSGSLTEVSKTNDRQELHNAIENYQSMLRNRVNPKNLKLFVHAFLKRTSIVDKAERIKCPVLFITGQKSVFRMTTATLHQALVKVCADKGRVEFIEVGGVANVLEEKPDKLAECFQYFLQGLGVVSSLPMHHVKKPGMHRGRSLSMEEYDQPMLSRRMRTVSGGSGTTSPMSTSPPK